MSEKYIRGALIEFMETFIGTTPNVIVFQFNPETMTHAWTQPEPAAGQTTAAGKPNPLAVKGYPGESFSFTLELDSNEMIVSGSPAAQGIAVATGVYTRLAALEMLQYPVISPPGLVGAVTAAANAIAGAIGGSGGVKKSVPKLQIPVVLFVWGPGRIVPVRVTALSVTEKLYDQFLNPVHADVQVTLRVLTPEELAAVTGPLKEIATVAYTYSLNLRQSLALTNLGEAVESVIGMLPI